MSEQSPEPTRFQYEELPTLPETFADSIGQWYFEGNTLRVEFLVSRLDQGKPSQQPTVRRFPACRLVLTMTGAIELLNRCQQLAAALEKTGLIKHNPPHQAAASNVS